MKVTDNAVEAIIDTMRSKGLNTEKYALEIMVPEIGGMGMAFTEERMGRSLKFGDLTVVLGHNVDDTDVVIDFGQVDDKLGLIFISEEQYVNNQTD